MQAIGGYRLTIDGKQCTLTTGDHPALVPDGGHHVLYADELCRFRVEAGSDEALTVLAIAGFEFDDCR